MSKNDDIYERTIEIEEMLNKLKKKMEPEKLVPIEQTKRTDYDGLQNQRKEDKK